MRSGPIRFRPEAVPFGRTRRHSTKTMPARIVLSRGQELLREIVLDKPFTIVGRDPSSDIVIDDITVSKRHMRLELVGQTLYVEDLSSTNGLRVNGHAATRQVVHHLDVIEIGNHKIYVFDDAMLPGGTLRPESTVQTDYERTRLAEHAPAPQPGNIVIHAPEKDSATLPLADTQPTTASRASWRVLGLKRLDDAAGVVRLDQANTMVGAAGHSALLVRRRDALYLSRLSHETLRINGREVGAGSYAVGVDDVVEVGSVKYLVVALGP